MGQTGDSSISCAWASRSWSWPAKGSQSDPGDRDLLWGVAYRVDSVAQTVARLRADGIDVSDPRPGNALGTVVSDLKPGFSHDVRTLFIEKEARV